MSEKNDRCTLSQTMMMIQMSSTPSKKVAVPKKAQKSQKLRICIWSLLSAADGRHIVIIGAIIIRVRKVYSVSFSANFYFLFPRVIAIFLGPESFHQRSIWNGALIKLKLTRSKSFPFRKKIGKHDTGADALLFICF